MGSTMKTMMAAALAGGLLFTAASANAEVVDKVAAVVNDHPIALSEVEQRAAPELAQVARERDPQKRADLRKRVMQGAVDALISEKLLEVQMDELGITVSDQEIDLGIEDVRRQNGMSAEQFEQALRSEGYSVEAYKTFMRGQLRRLKLINMKVRSKVKIADEELRNAYNQWARMEQQDPEVHARHILVQVAKDATPEQIKAAEEKARAIAEEARKPGIDFVELAKKKSEGPSAEDGGDLGYFKRGMMVPEFDKVAFSLDVGGVSDPIRTRFGFHVIKVEDRRALPVKTFEEMKGELQEKIFRDQMEKYTEQYVKELRQKATVEVRI